MTAMFVQLRRVVYVLLLLHVFAGRVQAATGQPTLTCTRERENDLKFAEKRMKESWESPGTPLVGGKACLEVWEREVKACNDNHAAMEIALNATTEVVESVKKFRGGKGDKNQESCRQTNVQEYLRKFDQMKKNYDAAVPKAKELAENAVEAGRKCFTYTGNLAEPARQLREALAWYKEMVLNDEEYRGCGLESRGDILEDYTGKSREMDEVLKNLTVMKGYTQVCGLASKRDVGDPLRKKYDEFLLLCPQDLVSKQKPVFESQKKEEIVSDKGPKSRREGEEYLVKQKALKKFEEKFKPLEDKYTEERKQDEERRKAEAEARKLKRAQEKQAAIERARREQEEMAAQEEAKRLAEKKKEEETKRLAEKKKEEEKRRAEERKKEEESKRIAEEQAKKAKMKKDGSNGPALVHSPLLLIVLLCVLGCTLVC
ncbi:uncharacterized protein TM35_000054690 [Trypanosoma theileri]|uniref:Uncharacterized protein n=1 Tax=Trypanosoma theileri TaxID=67003 RepID=A0A1X0P5E6_9TRYP|nr:uncharacterized protein TM35_000054690 [Trypanosoma theileri]ORC91873.1 hypothetical protein TM35_000054690 [Trypanosoma theileri]